MPIQPFENKLHAVPGYACLALALALSACAGGHFGNGPAQAKIVQSGVLQCFEADLLKRAKPPTCELSAAALAGQTLLFSNDKPLPTPDYSPVMAWPLDAATQAPAAVKPVYLQARPFVEAIKYEAMTVAEGGGWIIASTGFDRHSKDKPEQDRYNTLLAWPADKPEQVSVIAAETRQGVTSSSPLRAQFFQALGAGQDKSIAYFKIEGLAALPERKIVFGVRELGADYEHFSYVVRLIETSYTLENGKLQLQGDFKQVYSFTPPSQAIAHTVGLSSLEFDPASNQLYMLTSYEESDKAEGMGGYLWVLPLPDLRAGKAATLVQTPDGKPLRFSHKPEGLAILGNHRILVVHDDDRAITKVKDSFQAKERDRQLNESAYDIVQFE